MDSLRVLLASSTDFSQTREMVSVKFSSTASSALGTFLLRTCSDGKRGTDFDFDREEVSTSSRFAAGVLAIPCDFGLLAGILGLDLEEPPLLVNGLELVPEACLEACNDSTAWCCTLVKTVNPFLAFNSWCCVYSRAGISACICLRDPAALSSN